MRLYKIDGREIRSFKLQRQILNLRQFFEKPKSFGVFMMNDLLQPEDRMTKRPNYNMHNLKIAKLPKKVGYYLTQNKRWDCVAKLLSGNVFMIQNKNEAQMLPRETLNFLLNNEKYALRFFFWNQNFYRATGLNSLLTLSTTDTFKPDFKVGYQILKLSTVWTIKKNNLFSLKAFEARLSEVSTDQLTPLTNLKHNPILKLTNE